MSFWQWLGQYARALQSGTSFTNELFDHRCLSRVLLCSQIKVRAWSWSFWNIYYDDCIATKLNCVLTPPNKIHVPTLCLRVEYFVHAVHTLHDTMIPSSVCVQNTVHTHTAWISSGLSMIGRQFLVQNKTRKIFKKIRHLVKLYSHISMFRNALNAISKVKKQC